VKEGADLTIACIHNECLMVNFFRHLIKLLKGNLPLLAKDLLVSRHASPPHALRARIPAFG
jgi:hypothetical protein